MDKTKITNQATEWSVMLMDNLDEPVVLEQHGEAKAVLISLKDYQHYQTVLARQDYISARQARRAANQAVFGDLVGCPLSCEEPLWIPKPEPHWHIPYRLFDGTLMVVVEVDAYTGQAAFTKQERTALLERVRQAVTANEPT